MVFMESSELTCKSLKKLSPLKIVMFTSDGAEVMLGKYGGVQAKLKVS